MLLNQRSPRQIELWKQIFKFVIWRFLGVKQGIYLQRYIASLSMRQQLENHYQIMFTIHGYYIFPCIIICRFITNVSYGFVEIYLKHVCEQSFLWWQHVVPVWGIGERVSSQLTLQEHSNFYIELIIVLLQKIVLTLN